MPAELYLFNNSLSSGELRCWLRCAFVSAIMSLQQAFLHADIYI